MIDAILRAAGKTTALIGTIEYHWRAAFCRAVNTTPESLDLFRMFHELEQAGGTHATLEASSHALDLGRIYAMQFHTAAFTNLTRDHLDYHHTMEAYFAAKQLLFRPRERPPPRFAVLNADDELGPADGSIARIRSFLVWHRAVCTAGSGARMVRAVNIRIDVSRGCASISRPADSDSRVHRRWSGQSMSITFCWPATVALTHGLTEEEIQEGLTALPTVPGSFERVEEGQPFMVVVDYAHTDDALRNVIAAARGLKPKRVITLFGCGGDRDRTQASPDGHGGRRSKRFRRADFR